MPETNENFNEIAWTVFKIYNLYERSATVFLRKFLMCFRPGRDLSDVELASAAMKGVFWILMKGNVSLVVDIIRGSKSGWLVTVSEYLSCHPGLACSERMDC